MPLSYKGELRVRARRSWPQQSAELGCKKCRRRIQTVPHWILACKNCGRDFQHSEIKSELFGLAILGRSWIDKPVFPPGGQMVECPRCRETSLYQRYMLRFRDD